MKLYWRIKKESDTSPGKFYWTWEKAVPIEQSGGNTIGYGTLSCIQYKPEASSSGKKGLGGEEE